jgi:hypothetical protein
VADLHTGPALIFEPSILKREGPQALFFLFATRTTHAVLIVDQAVGHTTQKLEVPENITILRLPELNLEDNLWQFMRDTWLSSRILRISSRSPAMLYGTMLLDQPWRIMSYRTGHMRHINQWLV